METAGFTYGSDTSGLVWGFLFGREAQPVALDSNGARAWLLENAGRGDGREFIWLHFNLSHAASEKWLRSHVSLADEFYETLHQGSRSTRIELAENTLIAVVNDVLHNFSFEASDISTLWLSVAQNIVISARRSPLQSIERLRQAIIKHHDPIRSSVELLIHLLRDQADVLVNIVRDAVARVDDIEDKLLAGRLVHKREDLGTLRRVLVRLQRLLAPEPAALFRLLQRPPQWMAELDTQELRQSTEEFSVVLSDMSSLQERIKLLQEEIAARVNEENNRSLFVLTIVTVLALPINIIAGMLGMNVGGIPLAQHPHGFWIIVGVIITFTVVAGWLVVRVQRNN
ncbi:transporter [Janthinobacterium agaricidamnosum]|uniref:CorA-like Mg2+ transporter family protein n=1 Tax=Janthinobacterium agaricidamnosum NBRC 102515 = DSM 9628 TaxID=1349767 RepID=W0V425_9BURK|nr:transporter [Janthinobacterium agaricidamnosum]CDG82631.1 corA-like Mg2+ transporter family protein [Janthinobacterium agaricidamnosum NBRC 102515 = DSM 9628]